MSDLHVQVMGEDFGPVFRKLRETAEVLVLCGDLTHNGLVLEASRFAEMIAELKMPVLGVLGNHDHFRHKAAEIKCELRKAGMYFLDEKPFVWNGLGFVGIKGFGGGFIDSTLPIFEMNVAGGYEFDAEMEIALLKKELHKVPHPDVAVFHYAPIQETLKGEAHALYPHLGSDLLGKLIDEFDPLLAVHGHAHHGAFEGNTKKGIPVFNCALDILRRDFDQSFMEFELAAGQARPLLQVMRK